MSSQGKERILEVATEIAQTERRFGMDTSVEDYLKELKFGLVEVVYEWARGTVRIVSLPFSHYFIVHIDYI